MTLLHTYAHFCETILNDRIEAGKWRAKAEVRGPRGMMLNKLSTQPTRKKCSAARAVRSVTDAAHVPICAETGV